MKRVAVGISGGVDSSVSAALLKEQGYEVTGVFLDCFAGPGCRTEEDRRDALKVAVSLEIPFKVIDLRQAYQEKVMEYFVESYRKGLTPNPDVVCNQVIKFGMFYDWARGEGFDAVATGHYARVVGEQLVRGRDKSKDQSYFLYRVKKEQLKHLMFPVGNMLKEEVREEAKKRELLTADKPDSMGICFVGEINVAKFLKETLGESPGEVVYHGKIVGEHKGLWFYTVGQRAGEVVDKGKLKKAGVDTTNLPPLYVIDKDRENKRLVLGMKEETYRKEFSVKDIHWIEEIDREREGFIRIRNLGELHLGKVLSSGRVITEEPIMGVAEGQSAVFYERVATKGDEVVLGGGVISG